MNRRAMPANRQRPRWAAFLPPALLLVWLLPTAEAQRLADSRLKNGSAVRRVFRDVVAQARRATVRVECEGEVVALGAVVDPAGYVLTKASELQGSVVCRLSDGRRLPVDLVGLHREFDVAMLKVEASDLSVVEWSTRSDDPAVGTLLATPGPEANPVAVGVLSVARRRIDRERGVLGIAIADDLNGPRITRIFPNSGAADAGLKVDDVVVRAAGKVVDSAAELTKIIGRFRPGETVKLLIRRGEKDKEVVATLGSPLTTFLTKPGFQNQMGGDLSRRRDGFPAVLQHDSVLRPQDCGGVVVDLTGRAVGLNIARAGRVETYAVPASTVLPMIDELKSGRLAPREPARPQIAEEGPN